MLSNCYLIYNNYVYIGIVVLVVVALLVLWTIASYNGLIRSRNQVDNAWSQIDVQLKRRIDLIPNLVETARAYLQHERDTLERVTAARAQVVAATDLVKNQPNQPGPIKSLNLAEGALAGAMGRFMAVVEAYPELKAQATLADAMRQNSYLQKEITAARTLYNDTVAMWNQEIFRWPTNQIVAARAGYTTRIPFIASAETKAEARGTFF